MDGVAGAAARRGLFGALLQRAGVGAAVGCGAGLVAVGLGRQVGAPVEWWWLAAAPAAIGLIAGSARAWRARPSPASAARRLDEYHATKDRILSALELARGEAGAFESWALREGASAASRARPREAIPLRPGRSWLVASACAGLAVVAGLYLPRADPSVWRWGVDRGDQPREQALADVRRALESLRQAAAPSAPATGATPDELRAVEEIEAQLASGKADPQTARTQAADALEATAGQLEHEADRRRTELSAAREALAQAARRAGEPGAAPSELGAIADALRRGDVEAAARAAQELAQRAPKLSSRERDALAKDLDAMAQDVEGQRSTGLAGVEANPESVDPPAPQAGPDVPQSPSPAKEIAESLRQAGRELRDRPSPEDQAPAEAVPGSPTEREHRPTGAERPSSERSDPEPKGSGDQRAPSEATPKPPAGPSSVPPPGEPGDSRSEGSRPQGKPDAGSDPEPAPRGTPKSPPDAPASREPTRPSSPAGADRARPSGPSESQRGERRPSSESQAGEAKPNERDPGESKPSEPKPTGSTPTRSAEAQPGRSEPDSGQSQRTESKPAKEGQGVPPKIDERSQGAPSQRQPGGPKPAGEPPPAPGASPAQPQAPGEPRPEAAKRSDRSPHEGQQPIQPSGAKPGEDGAVPTRAPHKAPGQAPSQAPAQTKPAGDPREAPAPSPDPGDARPEGQTPGQQGQQPRDSSQPFEHPQPGAGSTPNPQGLERFARQLKDMAEDASRSRDARRQAEQLREQAQRLMENASPEDRRRLGELARRLGGQPGWGRQGPRLEGMPEATEPWGEPGAVMDARSGAAAPDRTIGELEPSGPAPLGAAPESLVQGVRDAAAGAERAIEQQAVPQRHADLVKRVFGNYARRLGEPASPKP